jgi:hypothetical protein
MTDRLTRRQRPTFNTELSTLNPFARPRLVSDT